MIPSRADLRLPVPLVRHRHRSHPPHERGRSVRLRPVRWRASSRPVPGRHHLQGIRLLPHRLARIEPEHELRLELGIDERQRQRDGHVSIDEPRRWRDGSIDDRDEGHDFGVDLVERESVLGLGVQPPIGPAARVQADCACRVPQRRQKRAFADSDRPHWPQLWTPMFAAALATSRADASQNPPGRAPICADETVAPRDR
jgi:hypothetical protein